MTVFVIEDEFHAEWQGQFHSSDAAFAEVRTRASVAWEETPNRCPCISWKTCGRDYVVIEFDDQVSPWKEISRTLVLSVNASGTTWQDKGCYF